MLKIAKKATLATALAASAVVGLGAGASPAMARDYYGNYHRGGGDTAGAAIAGGIIGLALGAIIASSSNNHHDRYRDGGYYRRDGRAYNYNYNDGYYRDYRDNDRRDQDRDYYERRGYDGRDQGDYRRGY